MPNGQFPEIIQLGDLNGQNGFKLDGEFFTNGVYYGGSSGHSLSTAGDINGDGYADLIIGAPYASGGSSYVVFGGPNVSGSGGRISLSNLNGSNGFKLIGESSSGNGYSVNTAGDFNADGYDDLLIGAPWANSAGRGYVVFGGPNVGDGGMISLSGLNGTNGFTLNGEGNGIECGCSVSGGG